MNGVGEAEGTRRRGRGRRRRRQAVAIGGTLTPLFDVLFLLLLFLVVAANFDVKRIVAVDLPAVASGSHPPREDARSEIVIILHADGGLEWNGAPVAADALRAHLAARPREERLLPVVIQGDASARLEAGLGVLDILRATGYTNCSFEVRRLEPEPGR